MTPFNSFVGFLATVDAYSNHVWAIPIRNKSALTIRKALTTIFDSITHPVGEVCSFIEEVATDQGTKVLNSR